MQASAAAVRGLQSSGSVVLVVALKGFGVLLRVGSSQSRDEARVPCICKQVLNHWETKELPIFHSF